MKRQDRSHFDNAWEKAFDGAEMAPTDQVWDKIELGLAKQANSGYKKRILFFKLMAAASVLFAAVVGGVTIYENNFDQQNELATHETTANRQEGSAKESAGREHTSSVLKKSKSSQSLASDFKDTDKKYHSNNTVSSKRTDQEGITVAQTGASKEQEVSDKTNSVAATTDSEDDKRLKEPLGIPSFTHDNSNKNIASLDADSVEGFGVLAYDMGVLLEGEMHLVPRYAEAYQMKKETKSAWVGVDMAMGQNSPSTSSSGGGADMAMAEFQATNNSLSNQTNVSEEQAGNVLMAGIAVGKHLSDRWIVESGVSYIKRSTLAESNLAVSGYGRSEALNSLSNASSQDQVILTNSYELKNTYNSIAVPIQAGYLLLDRRFDIAIKAGVANEILLWNRVEDTSGNLESVTINSGEGSQYNTYLISGLVGSEFSYLIADHYYISLAPQMRKSINSITKSDEGEVSRPLIFTFGFKVNYLFK